MVDYIVVLDGKPQGPYTLSQIKELNIKPDSFVRKPGMDDYKEAHEFAELRELLGFHYQQTAPQYFASFDQRLLASAIDFFILLIFYIFFVLLLFIFINDKGLRISTALTFLAFVPLAKIIYGSFAEASIKQATIGKRLLDIKVTDMMGNKIELSVSFGRNFAKFFSVLPFFFGYLYSFLNKKQQCFHDLIVGTLVIKQRLI